MGGTEDDDSDDGLYKRSNTIASNFPSIERRSLLFGKETQKISGRMYSRTICTVALFALLTFGNSIVPSSAQSTGEPTSTTPTSTTPTQATSTWTTTEATTEPPYYDPTKIPDLQHVNRYISDTVNDLSTLLNDTELEGLKNELLKIQETGTSDVKQIIQVGVRQQSILDVVSHEVAGNIKFCFDVVESMITEVHYNQTHQECLEKLDVNITMIMEHFETKYHDIVSDLSALQVSYRDCLEDDLCKAQFVLKLYDLMFTSHLKLENELKQSKAYMNEAIMRIRTCTVEVADYYTSIFDVVRQCIKNVQSMGN